MEVGTTFPPEVLWQNAIKSSPVKLLLIMINIKAEFSIFTIDLQHSMSFIFWESL